MTMNNRRTVFSALVAAASALAASSVPHDSLVPLTGLASTTLEVRYQPEWHVGNGCHPYPAVDQAGDWSGGLDITGAPSAGCKDTSKAQAYVRSASYNGKYAMVYGWYMPKDELSPLIGHRHDWEGVVVFLDSATVTTPVIDGVAASAHGDWRQYPTPSTSNTADMDGVHVKVQYSAEGLNTHAVDITDKGGDFAPLVRWEDLSSAAQAALNNGDNWGDSNPLISDAHFESNIEEAWMW